MKSSNRLFRTISFVLVVVMVLVSFAGCSSEPISGPGEAQNNDSETTPTPTQKEDTQSQTSSPDTVTDGQQGYTDILPVIEVEEPEGGVAITFNQDGTFLFSNSNSYFSNTVEVVMAAPQGSKIYYTLDGSEPDETDTECKDVLKFEPIEGEFPDAYVLRAKALFTDGTWSKTAAKTYFVAENVKERYSTLVFSISGEPEELTQKPEGIFTGKNYEKRGIDSERKVYIEMINPDGTGEIGQFGGVRIYGGYSRQNSIKSMKLFSRSSYDEDHKNFKLSDFGTPKLDGSDKIITKYDKLVLRDAGNDYQFCFLRDELSQTLCKNAGFEVYEAVLPAVAYLNGKYYGLFWLHESYCDKYFKEKFGDDAEGEFVILEGGDQKKNSDEDEFTDKYVDAYNKKYNEFIAMDLTNDTNYNKLNEFMEVENYLDFFAWNIALNNWDWPNNNYKCYRYVPTDNDPKSTGVFDGRWRFLPHDMDYSYGLYGQDATQPYYDTLKVVTNPRDTRYAPLFTKLMERKDCRDYFYNKSVEFIQGALCEQSIMDSYKMLDESRRTELLMFYDHMDQLRKKGDFSLWCSENSYYESETDITSFAAKRQEYVIKYMDRYFETFGDEPRDISSIPKYSPAPAGDASALAGPFWADPNFDPTTFDWSTIDTGGFDMSSIDWSKVDASSFQWDKVDWSKMGENQNMVQSMTF